MKHVRAALLASLLVGFGAITDAHAQSAAVPPAIENNAELQFQKGMKAYAEHNLAEACPAFAESYRLDPSGGTLQNLAICYEEQGKTATAYARFLALRGFSQNPNAPRPDRVKLADEHIKRLEPHVTHVRVTGPGADASLVVTVDGIAYRQVAWASGILVDPGEHSVSVEAKGKRVPSLAPLVAGTDGGELTVTIPRLEDAEPARSSTAPREPIRPYRTAGIVVGAAGLATVATGAVFGVLTITTNNDGKNKCLGSASSQVDGLGHCYLNTSSLADANKDHDQARTFATVSTVLFPVGLVATGLGAYFFIHKQDAAEPGKSGMSARLVASPTAMFVEGQF